MKGFILFNGNIRLETDFIERNAHRLLKSRHVDKEVRRWRKVLLITAAWQEREFEEEHLKSAISRIGIPSRFEGDYDENIQNLGLYHEFERFTSSEVDLYRAFLEKQAVVRQTKEFYRRKNNNFLRLLRDQTDMMENTFADITLSDILAYDLPRHRENLARFDGTQLLHHFCCQDVQDTMKAIIGNDQRMLDICHEIDRYFRDRSRLEENPTYIEIRDRLRRRIMSANSIFIFGGNLAVLRDRLHFFRLDQVFHEALYRGTNFYTVSAGSMILNKKIIVYDDYWGDGHERPRKEFEFFDEGLGLVDRITLFPHCMDRIQTDDRDNLSYLAHRFSSVPCVGLNEESFLLVEPAKDPETGLVRERYLSIGENDGVYVFGRSGDKICRRMGEELAVGAG